MKNKKKYIIGTLALVFILIGIIGNQQAQGNNTEKIYSFWDGLKNGAGNTYRPEGTKADFGYGVGILFGLAVYGTLNGILTSLKWVINTL
ncbi:MAG: hypothetical protein PVH61_08975 [Candidatus Aminicenantes bacterium]|jgi:hypothetical protein